MWDVHMIAVDHTWHWPVGAVFASVNAEVGTVAWLTRFLQKGWANAPDSS